MIELGEVPERDLCRADQGTGSVAPLERETHAVRVRATCEHQREGSKREEQERPGPPA